MFYGTCNVLGKYNSEEADPKMHRDDEVSPELTVQDTGSFL